MLLPSRSAPARVVQVSFVLRWRCRRFKVRFRPRFAAALAFAACFNVFGLSDSLCDCDCAANAALSAWRSLLLPPVLQMKIRAHCTAVGRFRTEDSQAGATDEDVMMLVECCPTGKQLSISGGFWLMFLATPAGQKTGTPLPLGYTFSDADAAAATGPDGVLNIFLEPKPGAAPGEPWGSLAAGLVGLGCWAGLAWGSHMAYVSPLLSLYFLQGLRLLCLHLQCLLLLLVSGGISKATGGCAYLHLQQPPSNCQQPPLPPMLALQRSAHRHAQTSAH